MKTYDEVKSILSEIEPTDEMYTMLTPEDLPVVGQLLYEQEPWLASRVVFTLSTFHTPEAYAILNDLKNDLRTEVRVSLAVCAKTLPLELSQKIILKLMEDNEAGVRKFAYQSILSNVDQEFINHLEILKTREINPYLNEILRNKIHELRVQ